MTTESNGSALAVREYTPKQLRQRIELAQRSFGLRDANPTQLNALYFLCEKWALDPLTDITLFEGQPFITIEGRLRLLRRHPEYRGFDCRPLSKAEKSDWGYEPGDIVVECAIRTASWGEVKARGKVTAAEVALARERAERSGKRPAPIGVHPVEIAEKRAIARAERAAFGQETVLDDEEVAGEIQTVITERNDPERIARNAAEYDRTIGAADWGEREPTPRNGEREAAPAETDRQITSKTDPLWQDWLRLEAEARHTGVALDTSDVRLGCSESALRASIDTLREAIDQQLATQDQETAALA